MPAVTSDLCIEYPAWETLGDLAAIVAPALAAAVAEAGVELPDEAEVSCLFCDDAAIRALNAQWRGIDKPTNVLSFPLPAGGPAPLLGDIVLAFETIEAEAKRDGKPLAAHVTHLVVHGFLHLIGYDHEDEAEADVMERLESRVMQRLGLGDPYCDQPATEAP
jgi:probable rRNA maturation factor